MALSPATQPMQTWFPAPNGDPRTSPVSRLVDRLGSRTAMDPYGVLRVDRPLVESIAAYGDAALPAMHRFFGTVPLDRPLAICEGLYTLQRLAENGVRDTAKLYPVVSRLNGHPSPYVQIYLSDAYRNLHNLGSFGPMLGTLVYESSRQRPSGGPTDVTEGIGLMLVQQIAETTADETVKRLLPYLNASPAAYQPQMLRPKTASWLA
jgi:hypothetical protein